jgi:hypothetical protein
VVTVTLVAPATPGGDVAVIWVADFTVNVVAAVLPNFTEDALRNPVPVMTTDVPPAVDPVFGLSEVMLGAASHAKRSADEVALVPIGVVTVTSVAVFAVPAGDVTVILVAELTVNGVAVVDPNFTDVAPVKLVPEITTLVPPAATPALGVTAVTVGGLTFQVKVV